MMSPKITLLLDGDRVSHELLSLLRGILTPPLRAWLEGNPTHHLREDVEDFMGQMLYEEDERACEVRWLTDGHPELLRNGRKAGHGGRCTYSV